MKPPIFIELCAGTAALSLRLQGGPKAKPPVSRMGAKTGYADAILAVLGLYPGQGAESYLWCEPDDGVRGLLMAYPQPEVLRAAAKILRGWKDEEPRALWERLRAELKAGALVEGAEGVARYVLVTGNRVMGDGGFAARKIGQGANRRPFGVDHFAEGLEETCSLPPTFIARDGRAVTPEEVARVILAGVWSYRQMEPESGFAGPVGRYPDTRPPALSARVARMAQATFPPVTIVADGRVVTPEEVARFCMVLGCSMSGKVDRYRGWFCPESDAAVAMLSKRYIDRLVSENGRDAKGRPLAKAAGHPDVMAPRLETLADRAWPPVTLTADARTLTPPRLPEGVVCYMDPPYLDTTGYKHDLPRSEVVRMARLWADAGATVCISEAEAIPDLIADGWHAVEISATRKGQKRTFTGQQKMAKKKQPAEWLTLSRPPSFVPRETMSLFG